MRLALDPRARRLLRRVPRGTIYSALELLLLSLLAMQCARLVWTVVTPVDPIGEWKASSALRPVAPTSTASLGTFDPFFRASATGTAPVVVTSLNLTLYGVREDRASGGGSAIIGTADGPQRSFAVGEEVMPGVRLTAVGFDNVTIDRGGTPEQIFMDQSSAATVVAPGGITPAPPPPPPPMPVVTATPPPPPVTTSPTGGYVVPQGVAPELRAAGFAPGDVVRSVNGQPITSVEQVRGLVAQSGGQATVQVERNGRTIPLRVRVPQ